MWCRHLTCFSPRKNLLVAALTKQRGRYTQDRLAQNYHSEDSPFTFFCCTYHPACPSFIRTATLIHTSFVDVSLLCNFPFFPLSKLNCDFLLAFILYLILHGIPRSEVELEAESQTSCDCKYGNGGYLLTNIMSANQDWAFFMILSLRAGRLSGFGAFALRGKEWRYGLLCRFATCIHGRNSNCAQFGWRKF